MRLGPYLCLGGVEIANAARTMSYGQHCLFTGCPCAALDGDFVGVVADPAPWYDPNVADSADFLGFLPETITLSPPYTRATTPANLGQSIADERLSGQVIEVRGWMIARNEAAMFYGETWLKEALRGSFCGDGCAGDEATVLAFCREEGTAEELALDFRRLVRVGTVSAPIFAELDADADWVIGTAQFQLASAMPYLYTPVESCTDDVDPSLSCEMTTLEWADGGTFRIEIENNGATAATDITVTGQISLDGSCPVTGDGASVPPSWSYTIASLEPESRLVIDGPRKQVLLYDPSDKTYRSGFASLDLSAGPLRWPDSGPCTTMCVTVGTTSADVVATIDGWLRHV